MKQLQSICGFLNFLSRCIVLGRAFTRNLYAYIAGDLKQHHHIRINGEIRRDLNTWLTFLKHPAVYCCPFMDFTTLFSADQIKMYSDASRSKVRGWGAICVRDWTYAMWDPKFIEQEEPSIEYLELFAVTVAVLNWLHRFRNCRIILRCDNQGVVAMINNTTSSCPNF